MPRAARCASACTTSRWAASWPTNCSPRRAAAAAPAAATIDQRRANGRANSDRNGRSGWPSTPIAIAGVRREQTLADEERPQPDGDGGALVGDQGVQRRFHRRHWDARLRPGQGRAGPRPLSRRRPAATFCRGGGTMKIDETAPLIGVPACVKQIDGMPFHAVGEKYLMAVALGARGLPLVIPAFGDGLDPVDLVRRLDGLLVTGSLSNVEPHHYGGPPHPPHTPP